MTCAHGHKLTKLNYQYHYEICKICKKRGIWYMCSDPKSTGYMQRCYRWYACQRCVTNDKEDKIKEAEDPRKHETCMHCLPGTSLSLMVPTGAVQDAAEHFIWDKELACASMGPLRTMPDINFMRRRTYLLSY